MPTPPRLKSAPLWVLWCLAFLIAGWRLTLAFQVLAHVSLPVMEGAMVIHWRRLDEFIAWFAIALLHLAREGSLFPPSTRLRRINVLLTLLLALGIACSVLDIASEQTNPASPLIGPAGFTAALLLAILSLLLAGFQIKTLVARTRSDGLTILDLWRFAACQWALLTAAAFLFLRLTTRPEDLQSNESVRRLLFLLPAAGVLPNTMMAAGIHAWGERLRRSDTRPLPPSPPRIRAWLAALIAINLAGLLMVLRLPALGIPGSLLALAAIVLYLLGFPASAWRSLAGRFILAAWILLALAWAGAGLERALLFTNQPVSTAFFGGAWRHLWSTAALTLWLLGTASLSLPTPPLKNPLRVTITLFTTGALLTAWVLFATSLQLGESQLSVMRWLFLGPLLECLALLIAAALLLRTIRTLRLPP